MNATLRCLLTDLQSITVVNCEGISAADANALFRALQSAAISVDCAMALRGEFDWKDERSRNLSSVAKPAKTPNDCPKCGFGNCRCEIASNE